MKQYLDFLRYVRDNGELRKDRTGTGTRSVFGYQLRFDLAAGFPLLTTKKCHTRSIIHELLWFLKGDTHVKYLRDHEVTIWDEWANAEGDLGPIYGYQWRHWGKSWPPSRENFLGENSLRENSPRLKSFPGSSSRSGIDQFSLLLNEIKKNPTSRRLIISAWNVADLPKMALPPCHTLFQFYVHSDGRLSCQLYQRSADLFLGVPFNIASYALLTMMVAHVTGLGPGHFVHTFGDAHLYLNHLDQVEVQLTRAPRPLPKMTLNPLLTDLFQFKFEDFQLEGYNPHPAIKAPIAV